MTVSLKLARFLQDTGFPENWLVDDAFSDLSLSQRKLAVRSAYIYVPDYLSARDFFGSRVPLFSNSLPPRIGIDMRTGGLVRDGKGCAVERIPSELFDFWHPRSDMLNNFDLFYFFNNIGGSATSFLFLLFFSSFFFASVWCLFGSLFLSRVPVYPFSDLYFSGYKKMTQQLAGSRNYFLGEQSYRLCFEVFNERIISSCLVSFGIFYLLRIIFFTLDLLFLSLTWWRFPFFFFLLVFFFELIAFIWLLSVGHLLKMYLGFTGECLGLVFIAFFAVAGISYVDSLLSLYLIVELFGLIAASFFGIRRVSGVAVNAGIRYFILNVIASCFFVLGLVYIYLFFGTLDLTSIFLLSRVFS